jgi:hypothetical protein
MSLTSYRAAPPRANSMGHEWPNPSSSAVLLRTRRAAKGGGTYSRFEEEVKRDIRGSRAPCALAPIWGFPLSL